MKVKEALINYLTPRQQEGIFLVVLLSVVSVDVGLILKIIV